MAKSLSSSGSSPSFSHTPPIGESAIPAVNSARPFRPLAACLDQDSRKLSATYAQMQNRTAAIVSHARLCRATSDPLAHWLRPSALHNRMAEGQAMNQQRTHWWPSIDTLVIILSLTVICFGVWLMAG